MPPATRQGRPIQPGCLCYQLLIGYATVLALTMPLLAQPCQRLELPGPEINTAAAASNGLGAKKVAVILFSFADHPLARRSVTPAQVRERLITASDSTHAFLQEVSFGHLSLTGHLDSNGDVFGWYTIPVPANNNRDLTNVVGTVLPLAQADGFDEANYDVVMFHHTVPSGWGGQAPFWNRVEIFNGFSSWVVVHEVLHIFGIDHANGYRCTQGNVEVPVSHTCQSVGYGDPFDIQGNSGYRHPNAYFKARLGWFCTHNMTTVPSTPGRYVYALKPIENASSALLGLRIPMPRQRVPLQFGFANPQDVDLFYYLEYRQPTAFDPFAAGDDVVHGVSIRINTDLNANHMALLIDTEPQTATFLDAPLTVGAAFGDAETGVTVRTLSTSPTEAVVEVTVNGCVDPTDRDCDDIPDVQDNCPDAPNTDQTDRDSDAVGDVCDNCLRTPNTDQEDQDRDRVGDACDNCPAT